MNTRQITTERLRSWSERLAEHNATPVVLIGVGHEHNSGEVILCIPAGPTDDQIVMAIVFALQQIRDRPGIIPKRDGESVSINLRRPQ